MEPTNLTSDMYALISPGLVRRTSPRRCSDTNDTDRHRRRVYFQVTVFLGMFLSLQKDNFVSSVGLAAVTPVYTGH